jgi:hypothetical protein
MNRSDRERIDAPGIEHLPFLLSDRWSVKRTEI